MPRPNYVNYAVPPGGHRETWLKALCDRLGLEYSHRDYLVAIDAALAAMVARVTENQTKGEGEMSKRVRNNLDGGLWVEYAGDYVAAAGCTDPRDTKPFVITYHKGRMPAFNSEAFRTVEELESAMREIEPDLRKWRLTAAD